MSRTAERWQALRESWPAKSQEHFGPFHWQDGAGGGNRVSAARLTSSDTSASISDLSDIETRFKAASRPAVFQVQTHEAEFDSLLAQRGYELHDATLCMHGSIKTLLKTCVPEQTAQQVAAQPTTVEWPMIQAQIDIWATAGIGAQRLAIMERVALDKTTVFSTHSGTGFVALSGDIAVVHALEVAPASRRRGVARALMRQAAIWASDHGAVEMVLLVTCTNEPAQALYSSLGMQECGRYHYRRKGDL